MIVDRVSPHPALFLFLNSPLISLSSHQATSPRLSANCSYLPSSMSSDMAFDEDGRIYIKLDPKGELNYFDKGWDDGAGGSIKQILLWLEEDYISGIQTVYERKGTKLISKRHGGTQGNFKMINPKRPLTWVSGHYGLYANEPENAPSRYYKVITSLEFGNEEEAYGPFGFPDGASFTFCPGTEIAGFHGSSNDPTTVGFGYISAIGIYVKTEAVGLLGVTSASSVESQLFIDENEL